MSGISEREVMRRLRRREHEEAEPPADLLARLKADIPAEIRLGPVAVEAADTSQSEPRRRSSRWSPGGDRRWLLAASLAATALAGLLAWRLMQQVPEPGAADFSARQQEQLREQEEDRLAGPGSAEPESVAAPPAMDQEAPALESSPPEAGAKSAMPGSIAPEARRERAAASPAPPAAESAPPYNEEITVTAEASRVVETPSVGATLSRRADDGAGELAPPRPLPAPSQAPARDALGRRTKGARLRPERLLDKEKKDLRALGYVAAEPVEDAISDGVEGGVAGGVVVGAPGGSAAAPASPTPATRNSAAPSTGGTAEPDDQAYGDVFFRSAGVNPFIDTDEDRLSTFGLDVDTASYTVARRYLADGHLPPPESVRVEEFVNFFHYGDRPPARGDFALRAEGAPTPFAAGDRYRLLRFSLRARQVSERARRPAVLTFVVDVSGSMDQENRLGLVKQALGLLLDQLRADDRVGLVIYGSRGEVLLEPTGDHGAIRRAVERLRPAGSTNVEEGLTLAYRVADRAFRTGAENRIVLCSDGVANVGATGPDSLLERIGTAARRGIELTTVGFGMGNLNDHLMEQLADRGDGRYVYVDTLDEARRVFVEDLTGTLQTVAKDAKVQVEFNPRTVARYRLLGYENRDIADDRFRDDKVDGGEVGAGHGVTALYEVKLQPGVADPREGRAHGALDLAILRLRYRSTATGKVVESARHLAVGELAPTWEQATPALRLAAVTAELAELLRGSYWAKDATFDALFRRAQTLSATFAGNSEGADVAELVSLIGKAARLKDQGRK